MAAGIFIVMAIILFLGMIDDKEKFNKRTYCYGFITCVVAAVIIQIVGGMV
ncbi:MAG: hypothetical protein LUH14_01140 [Clostridiaceae bacterium]|nr:hypothetical protein [Clostridiaceae bacterium]